MATTKNQARSRAKRLAGILWGIKYPLFAAENLRAFQPSGDPTKSLPGRTAAA